MPGRRVVSIAPLASAIALATLYAATRARIQTWETIAQVARVTGDPLLAERYTSTRLFHPQHLLFLPFALPWHHALAALGLARDPFLPLQLLNAACGALAAFLAGRIAVRLGASERRALAVMLAAGLAAAPWQYATEIAAITPSLAAMLMAAWLTIERRPVAAGVTMAAAVLLHQLAVLPAAVTFLGWMAAARGGRVRRRDVLAFGLACAAPIALAYMLVGVLYAHATAPAQFAGWVVTAGHRATFAPGRPVAMAFQTARGLIESVVSLDAVARCRSGGPAGPAGLALAAMLATGLAAAATLRGARRRGSPGHPFLGSIALSGVALTAFVGWYQPWNHVFWVFVPPFAAILAGVLAPSPGRARVVVPLALAVLGVSNLIGAQWPRCDAERAPYSDLVAFGRSHFHAGDLLVTDPGRTVLGEGLVALPFFTRIELLGVPAPEDTAGARAFATILARALDERRNVFVMPEAMAQAERVRPLRRDAIGLLRGERVVRVRASGAAR